MSALTAERNTVKSANEAIPNRLSLPIAAAVKVWKGGFVSLNASGYLVPSSTALGLIAVGRALQTVDNTAGANGAAQVPVEQGCFKWANSSGADQITQQNAGQDCYLVDDQTVALTDGVGTRSRAGKIIMVESDGLPIVDSGLWQRDVVNMTETITIPIPSFAALANGQNLVNNLKLGYAGRIRKMSMVTSTAVVTAGKAATLQCGVNPSGGANVPCTGGALALTSANQNAIGNAVDSTSVTAGGTFGASDGITVAVSSVTTFVEGAGALIIELG